MEEVHSSKKNKNKSKPQKVQEMGFWDHLSELRGHLIRSIIALLIFAIVAFIGKKYIFDLVLLAPLEPDFITNIILCKLGTFLSIESLCFGKVDLILQNIQMSGQFMMHMYVSIMTGLIMAMPYIIWEIWRFIVPALHSKEKSHSRGAVFVISFLFTLGVLFAYYIIVPLTINFLGNYHVSDTVDNQIHLNSYISTIVSVVIGVGLVFELPVFIYFLSKIGIVNPAFLKKNRKIMIVIVFTLSAIITPPDIFSQVLVSIPLLILYEIGIVISKRVVKKNEEKMAG